MDPSSFPKQYGGELDWQWGDMPNLDEPARELLQGLEQAPAEGKTKKEILKGPMLFKGDRIEVLGTEDGKDRRMEIPVPKPETKPNDTATTATSSESTETETANGDVSALENEKTGLDDVAVNAHDQSQTATAAA